MPKRRSFSTTADGGLLGAGTNGGFCLPKLRQHIAAGNAAAR
jgi:hypothetical protein